MANFDLTLVLHPGKLPTALQYEMIRINLVTSVVSQDELFVQAPSASGDGPQLVFVKQSTRLSSKYSSTIMLGGIALGLFIMLVCLIVLIKNGFFRRKKREELLKVKQRMSMAPNAFPNINFQLDDDEDDDDDGNDEEGRDQEDDDGQSTNVHRRVQ